MTMLNNFNNYSLLDIDCEKLKGMPFIKGTAIQTSVILQVSINYLLDQYPKINKEQALQALAYSTIYERDVIKDY